MIIDKSNIGIFGLGVMGRSLALNIHNKGYSISVYDVEPEYIKRFLDEKVKGKKNIKPTYDIKDFVSTLERPRKILLMITAGDAIDIVIEKILPFLDKEDIIIDGGNSYFKDTIRRSKYLNNKGIYLIGAGISGGEKGALEGPSIMPSGNIEAYRCLEQIFYDISAKAYDGKPCCSYIGENGSGHYVKMVHNGIEYADMQLICEAYDLMNRGLKMPIDEIQETFDRWNNSELKSYLIEITSKILKRYDEDSGLPMINCINDVAKQKGTGKWTSMESIDIGVATPTIVQSVFSRYLSSVKKERLEASKLFGWEKEVNIKDKDMFLEKLKDTLYISKICCYAQGFSLLHVASKKYNWNLKYDEIALLWRSGCIIRAEILDTIGKIFNDNPDILNLLMHNPFKEIAINSQASWRDIVSYAVQKGISTPAFSSALNYFDSYRTDNSSANLLQAQRDFFGSHKYERIDKPGIFHTNWE